MPMKRTVKKARNFIVTLEIVEAFKARDHQALHLACGLKPWEPSPLDDLEDDGTGTCWNLAKPKVVAMRREILKEIKA